MWTVVRMMFNPPCNNIKDTERLILSGGLIMSHRYHRMIVLIT